MLVYATAVDQGDGSLYIEFFEETRTIEMLEEAAPEVYRQEGWIQLDLADTRFVRIQTHAEAEQHIMDYYS